MEFKHTVDGRVFTLIVDDNLVKTLDVNLKEAEELNRMDPNAEDIHEHIDKHYVILHSGGEEYPDIESIMMEKLNFAKGCVEYIKTLDAKEIVTSLPKKKNGTFRKGAVKEALGENLYELWEDSYCYAYDVLRWKVIDDTVAELQLTYGKETW